MARCESETTVEELDIATGLKYTIHSADIVAFIEGDKGCPACYTDPGEPAGANVHDLGVTKCYVRNRESGQEHTSVNKRHLQITRDALLGAGWH